MRVRIKRYKKTTATEPLLAEPIYEAKTVVKLGDITEDKVVALLRRWREFVNSLDNDQKQQVRRWACGDQNGCTPQVIDRWARALKGSLQ